MGVNRWSQMSKSFVTSNYTLERLLLDLQRGRLEDLQEILSGDFKGKTILLELLSPIEGNSNGDASAALKGVFSSTVESVAEKKNMTPLKFRRAVTKPLASLLKSRPKKVEELTLVGVIRKLIESPSDDLVEKLMVLSTDREDIGQEISAANTNRTELIDAIRSTSVGVQEPTEDNFDTLPQVNWVKYSLVLGLRSQKKVVRSSGFLEIEGSTQRMIDMVKETKDFDEAKDIKEIRIDYPRLYDLIFGKKEMVYNIEESYEALEPTNEDAREYLLFLNRNTKVSALYPKLNAGSLNMSLVKKGNKLNPYLLDMLRSDSVDYLNDTLGKVASESYISSETIQSAKADVSIGEKPIPRKEREEVDRANIGYYYYELFDIISSAILKNKDRMKNYKLDDKDIDAIIEQAEKADAPQSVIDIINKTYSFYSGQSEDDDGADDDADDDDDDDDDVLVITQTARTERGLRRGPKDIVEMEKESDIDETFQDILDEDTVKIILNRVGIANPRVISRITRKNPYGFLRTKDENVRESVGSLGENIMEKEDIANQVVYLLAMRDELRYKKVDYFTSSNDPLIVFQIYYNLAWTFDSNIENSTDALTRTLMQDDTTNAEKKQEVQKFIKQLDEDLVALENNITKSVNDKLKDIADRPRYYENETKVGMLRQLAKRGFLAVDREE